MALSPGTRIGPYEITALLGVGGMGEVYRATDTNLGRQVAVKVLSESCARDAEGLARFEREAKALAALNHPNIAAIYSVENSHGLYALIMELAEGMTLSELIAGGSGKTGSAGLPIDQALPIAKQIVVALETAHAHGIVHRDLKPANVKVLPDGSVKVLDFGLAKLNPTGFGVRDSGSLDSPPSQSPTAVSPALTTVEGAILGTAAYMSPEQAQGKTADARSDIWAFGAVLYEMLTGTRAFAGETVSDVLASVLAREPDWDRLPPGLPSSVGSVLRACLRKDPKQRLGDAQSLRLMLDGAFDAEIVGSSPAAAITRPFVARIVPFAAVALLVGVTVGLVAWWSLPSRDSAGVARFEYVLPANQSFEATIAGFRLVAISPNGRRFVYATTAGLYVRALDDLEPRFIPGTEGTMLNPFFSPDGESVGYLVPGEVRRVASSGGQSSVILRDAGVTQSGFHGASWAADDTVLVGLPQGIVRVPAAGGAPAILVAAEEGEQMGSPRLLPDGESILFSLAATAAGLDRWDRAQIVVQSLRTGDRTTLWQGGTDAHYVSSGHIVFARGSTLFAMPFDVERRAVGSDPIPVVQGVQQVPSALGTGGAASVDYDVSENGRLVYLPAGAQFAAALISTVRTLTWVDRQGRETPLSAPPRPYSYPRVSPDGSQIVIDVRDGEFDLWTWSVNRETLTRLTFDPLYDRFPVWSPDGRRIAFSSQRDGSRGNPYWQSADGSGEAERLADEPQRQVFPVSFTPDGGALLVHGDPGDQRDDIGVVVLNEVAPAVRPLLHESFNERNPEVSPDGRWLAYESDESGRFEIYVRPFPNVAAGRWQISTGGGSQPVWAPSGRELFYREADAMMTVPVEPGPTFVAGRATMLFRGRYAPSLGGRNYDLSPDGQRFLMLKVGDGDAAVLPTTPARFVVVENWFDDLRRLAPGR